MPQKLVKYTGFQFTSCNANLKTVKIFKEPNLSPASLTFCERALSFVVIFIQKI